MLVYIADRNMSLGVKLNGGELIPRQNDSLKDIPSEHVLDALSENARFSG